MAASLTSLELLTSCPVCYEGFTKDGARVPRLLPCSHTLCSGCIKQLIQMNLLKCPECQSQHCVTQPQDPEKTFTQNKYMVTLIRQMGGECSKYEKCDKHGKEMNLFCQEENCKKSLCSKCLPDHRRHDVVEVEAVASELDNKAKTLADKLETKLVKLQEMKDIVKENIHQCLKDLNKDKEKMAKEFDKMIEEAENIGDKSLKELDYKTYNYESNLAVLRSMEATQWRDQSLQEMNRNMGTVENVFNKDICEICFYPEYRGNIPNKLGSVVKKTNQMTSHSDEVLRNVADDGIINFVDDVTKTSLMTSQKTTSQNKLVTSQKSNIGDLTPPTFIHASVFGTFNLIGQPYHVVLDATAHALITVRHEDGFKVKRLDLHTGAALCSVDLKCGPRGMAVVELGGRRVVALSYIIICRRWIEFLDVHTLQQVAPPWDAGRHKPDLMCASPPSTLLYVDISTPAKEIHVLNCHRALPRYRGVIRTQPGWIYDMCVVKNGGRDMLVCACGANGVVAYDIRNRQPVWRVVYRGMDLRRVTSDQRDHVIMYDYKNKCARVAHVASGRYLEKYRQELPGTTAAINWRSDTLVVTYNVDKTSKISSIRDFPPVL